MKGYERRLAKIYSVLFIEILLINCYFKLFVLNIKGRWWRFTICKYFRAHKQFSMFALTVI